MVTINDWDSSITHDLFGCTVTEMKNSPNVPAASSLQHLQPVTHLLIPMSLMAAGGGPMNITPSLSQSSANSGFSDRKP